MIHADYLVEAITRTQAVVHFSPDGVITDANDIFLKTMDYDHKEAVGKHHRIFMGGNAADRPEYAQFWATLCEGTKKEGEFKRVTKSGSVVWLSATYTPILKEGRVVSIVKLGRDITAEKVRAVEMATQVAAIDRTQAVVAFDVEGKVLTANDIFLKTMGYSLDEVVGKPHRMFMPDVLPPDYEAFWQALAAGQPKTGEFKRFAKNGRPSICRQCKRNLSRHNGYELKEVVGKHHRLFMTPEDAAKLEYIEFWKVMSEGSGFAQGEFKRVGKGGKIVWLNATYTPIVDDRVIKIVKYAQDMTEEKLKK